MTYPKKSVTEPDCAPFFRMCYSFFPIEGKDYRQWFYSFSGSIIPFLLYICFHIGHPVGPISNFVCHLQFWQTQKELKPSLQWKPEGNSNIMKMNCPWDLRELTLHKSYPLSLSWELSLPMSLAVKDKLARDWFICVSTSSQGKGCGSVNTLFFV